MSRISLPHDLNRRSLAELHALRHRTCQAIAAMPARAPEHRHALADLAAIDRAIALRRRPSL